MKYDIRLYQETQPVCENELFFRSQSLEIWWKAGLCEVSAQGQVEGDGGGEKDSFPAKSHFKLGGAFSLASS